MAKSSRTQQPITRHPLFPAIVALWFGALFGLGSLAIRPSVLESAVVASGIDLVVSAAAPPLGVTARILLALAMALVGGMVGITIGLRLGRVKAAPTQRRRTSFSSENTAPPRRADAFASAAEAAPRRPLSVFDEMADGEQIEADDYEPAASPRRRQLALEESSEPDYARTFAPLPGGDLDPTGLEVLDLSDALPAEEPEPIHSTAETHVPDPETPNYFSSPAEAAPAIRQFGAPVPAQPAEAASIEAPAMMRRFDAMSRPAAAVEVDSDEDDRSLPPRNLGGRFAAPAADPATPAPAEAAAAPAVPTEYEPEAEPEPTPAPAPLIRPTGSAAAKLRSASLDSLSQLELIERLALSMQQRREAAAIEAAPAPEPVAPPAPAATELPRFGFEPKEPIAIDLPGESPLVVPPVPTIPASLRPLGLEFEVPEETGAPAFAPPAMPAAMRPIALDFGDDAEDDAIPHTRFAFSKPVAAMQNEAMEPETAGDPTEGYSSLLELGQAPLRAPLVRIEEPAADNDEIEPVVVFPGHGSRPFSAPAPAPAAPVEAAAPVQPGIRRFDAPPAAGAPTQPAAARIDPEETERALRAALATLQRMSGAA